MAVLIVDDQRAVREGLTRLLSCSQLPLRSVGTAATLDEALAMVALSRPEVVVLDVDLDGADGLSLISQLPPGTGVLVLSSHGDPRTRARAIAMGAVRFVEKHQPAAELLDAVAAVAEIARPRSREEFPPVLQGATSPGPWSQAPLRS